MTATSPVLAEFAPPVPTDATHADAPQASSKEPSRGRARKAFLALAVVVALLLVGVFVYVLTTRGKESTDNATVQADIVLLSARVGGTVLHVFVDENQHVVAGQRILQLDGAEYAAQVQIAEGVLAQAEAQQEQAEAQELIVKASATGGLKSAQAELVGSSARAASAEADIAGERALLNRARAEAKHAETDLARSQALREDGAIAQQQLDDAKLVSDSAHAALAGAQAKLTAADETRRAAGLGIAEARGRVEQNRPVGAQIAAALGIAALARGRVTSARASLDVARLLLSYTQVTAPVSGRVSSLSARIAATLSVGQPVAQLVPDAVYVTANFKETQTGEMHHGQRATISLDAYPHRRFEGRVESLSAGTGAVFSLLPPDNATGNFVKVVQRVPVRIVLVDPPSDVAMRAGLSADVTVHLR
jgi:membrane fusion protein (multidrug efflux system)